MLLELVTTADVFISNIRNHFDDIHFWCPLVANPSVEISQFEKNIT